MVHGDDEASRAQVRGWRYVKRPEPLSNLVPAATGVLKPGCGSARTRRMKEPVCTPVVTL